MGVMAFLTGSKFIDTKNVLICQGPLLVSINFTKSWRSAESLCVTEFKSVIDSFRNDEAGRLCQSDSLIILFGKRLWAKSIKKKRNMLLCQK